MRPELPQGFDERQLFELFDKVADQHHKLIGYDGKLPQTPRGRALRAFGQFLICRINGRSTSTHLYGGRPIVAPFANACGRIKYWEYRK
jgi:hypothetical protein